MNGSDFAGWVFRVKPAMLDDLFPVDNPPDDADTRASVGEYNRMVESAILARYPGASVMENGYKNSVTDPFQCEYHDGPEDIQRIAERVFETFDWLCFAEPETAA